MQHVVSLARRAMTLMECLVAMVVLTISAAIMASSVQAGLAAQEDALAMTLAGTAAESRISDYLARSYETIAATDVVEAIGTMTSSGGDAFSGSYARLGRHTRVTSANLTVPDFPGLLIPGYLIDVSVFDLWNGAERQLVSLQRFRPRTIEESDDTP